MLYMQGYNISLNEPITWVLNYKTSFNAIWIIPDLQKIAEF